MLKIKGILLLLSLLLMSSCEEVGDLIDPDKAPELDAEGIVVTADRVSPHDTISASIKATNPVEGPLGFEWKATGGNFIAPSDKDTVQWIAPLIGGIYALEVKVSNSSRKTAKTSRQVEVISATKPLVDLIGPDNDGYFVLYQDITVQARAEHENGISRVSLYINNSLIGQMSDQSKPVYSRTFRSTPEMVGKTVIKVEAEATNHITNSDQITINIQGIVPGKNGR